MKAVSSNIDGVVYSGLWFGWWHRSYICGLQAYSLWSPDRITCSYNFILPTLSLDDNMGTTATLHESSTFGLHTSPDVKILASFIIPIIDRHKVCHNYNNMQFSPSVRPWAVFGFTSKYSSHDEILCCESLGDDGGLGL